MPRGAVVLPGRVCGTHLELEFTKATAKKNATSKVYSTATLKAIKAYGPAARWKEFEK